MKRFFCTECKKVKRTQKWPYIIDDVANITPSLRIGECNFHRSGNRVPARKQSIKVTKPVKVVATNRKRAS